MKHQKYLFWTGAEFVNDPHLRNEYGLSKEQARAEAKERNRSRFKDTEVSGEDFPTKEEARS